MRTLTAWAVALAFVYRSIVEAVKAYRRAWPQRAQRLLAKMTRDATSGKDRIWRP